MGMGLYMVGCLVCCVLDIRSAITAPFLVIFAFGFFYVSVLTFQAQNATKRVLKEEKKLAPVTETRS